MKAKGAKYIVGLGDLVDLLGITNAKIFTLESIVKNPDRSDAEAGRAAREIRALNNKRVAIKNVLNKLQPLGFEDIKVEVFEVLNGKR